MADLTVSNDIDNFMQSASNAAAFDNIKQAATETATGVSELATEAEVLGVSAVDAVVRARHMRVKVETGNGGAVSIGDLGGDARGSGSVTIQASRSAGPEVASGVNSVAIGNGATASGTNSNASGYFATASSDNTTASGRNATASGNGATALGTFANATGGNTTASGSNATASGSNATASGSFANASGNGATASGTASIASGTASNATGSGATASQTKSGAFGFRAKSATANVQELGYWSSATVRAGAVRVHGTGYVAISTPQTDTAFTDGTPANPTITGNLTRASNVVTVNTSAAHNLVTGHQVTIAGCTPSTFNGAYTITKIDADTFTYVNGGSNESTTVSGTISVAGAGSEPDGTIFRKGLAFRVSTTGNLIATYCDSAGVITSRDLGAMT